MVAEYGEIDTLVEGLARKNHYEELCERFFQGCRIDSKGSLIPGGFFSGSPGSASLRYAMYELLGRSPDTFLLKHRVTRVVFTRNGLSGRFRFPGGVFRLPRLEKLIVRGIGISRLPDLLRTARSLRVLDLASNRFSVIPSAVFSLSGLTALNMSYNRLEMLPGGLPKLRKLQILNLRGNRIAEIPTEWHRLQNLRKLDLSMNLLNHVPDSLRTLVSLNVLRLAYNELPAAEEALWEQRVAEEHRAASLWG